MPRQGTLTDRCRGRKYAHAGRFRMSPSGRTSRHGQQLVPDPRERRPASGSLSVEDEPARDRRLVATLHRLTFALARSQTSAHGGGGRFILVADISPRLPSYRTAYQSPTYGYDGKFFYRLALNPVNCPDRVRRPHGRPPVHAVGSPALTSLSRSPAPSVPVMLVAVNVAAIGALGYLGVHFAVEGGRTRSPGCCCPDTSASSPACPGTPPSRSPPPACWPGCSRSGAPPSWPPPFSPTAR